MPQDKSKIGTIITPPGAFVDIHEKIAADFLAVHAGLDITFLVPNRSKGQKTPDIRMGHKLWEIKSPKGKSSRTIENNLRLALLQSPNIIIDLRRIDGRIPTKKLLNEIARRFGEARTIKNILVITRQDTLVDFRR